MLQGIPLSQHGDALHHSILIAYLRDLGHTYIQPSYGISQIVARIVL
jgi:hypothetical protein